MLRPIPGNNSGDRQRGSSCAVLFFAQSFVKKSHMSRVAFLVLRVALLSTVTLLALLLLPHGMLFCQSYFGTVNGVVTDPSQAAVPGATVLLRNQTNGFTFNTKTNRSGHYVFSQVPPGTYSVSVEMYGFEKAVRGNILETINGSATANFTLRIGSVNQTVEVTGRPPMLNTQNALTGQDVSNRFISDLPLVSRYVLDLTQLGPGMNLPSDQNAVSDTGTNFVSNGSRTASADVLVDGATDTNFEPNGGINEVTYTPTTEAIQEMKVEQTNFSAEYGFAGSTIVNMITKSGTNAFHGSAYDFLSNNVFDANNWFNDASDTPEPPVHQDEFGGTFGGPIKKNKLFFFADYDGVRSSSMSTYIGGVPTVAERQGDFGGLCTYYGGTFNSAGQCSAAAGQIWDPYSGTFQSPANQAAGAYRSAYIPMNNLATYSSPGNPLLNGTPYQLAPGAGNLIDPVAAKYIQLFPMPNNLAGGPYENWTTTGATPSRTDQFDTRLDYQLNARNLITVKYSELWSSSTPFNYFSDYASPSDGPEISGDHLAAINYTWTITPTLLLTSTLGITRGTVNMSGYCCQSKNPNPLPSLGLPSYLDDNGITAVPAMNISDYFAAGDGQSIGGDVYGFEYEGQLTGQLSEGLTWIRGNHELKFGFDGRLHQMNFFGSNSPVGQFSFDNTGSSQCPVNVITQCGGDSMASFLMGQFNQTYDVGTNYEWQYFPGTENKDFAGYAQDNWKATRKLTLNLGLRYQVDRPLTERGNRMNWFNPTVASPLGSISYVDPVTGQNVSRALVGGEVFASSNDRSPFVTDWSNIAPRLGFAYLFHKNTVIRGGYGIYYDDVKSGANGWMSYESEGFSQYTYPVTTYQNDGATPYLHLADAFSPGPIKPPGSSLGLLNDVGYGAIGPIKDGWFATTPYEQSWSFGIERQLLSNMVLDVYYVGKKGTNLYYEGANEVDILGPSIEKQTPTEIGNLENYVANPFSSIMTSLAASNIYYSYSSMLAPQIPAYQLLLPYPQYSGGVTTDEDPTANSTYNALQVSLNKRFSHGLELAANYTWSKSIDDASMYDDNVSWLAATTDELFAPQDPNNLELDRSLSTFDVPQMVKLNYVYDLPIGQGRPFLSHMPRPLELILGGWRTSGIWDMQSGFPLDFIMSNGGTPIPTYGYQRPNLVGTPTFAGGPEGDWINQYFGNPNVFQDTPAYTLGNAPRSVGSVRSPWLFVSNLSLSKTFDLSRKHENLKLGLRMDVQNFFNHPIFGTPDVGVGDPTFGLITYTNEAVPPRTALLTARISF